MPVPAGGAADQDAGRGQHHRGPGGHNGRSAGEGEDPCILTAAT